MAEHIEYQAVVTCANCGEKQLFENLGNWAYSQGDDLKQRMWEVGWTDDHCKNCEPPQPDEITPEEADAVSASVADIGADSAETGQP